MSQYKQGSSGLFLPTTGKSKMVQFGSFEMWAEDGSVWYECRNTGKSGSMSPSLAEQRFNKVLEMHGYSSDPGVERDAQERIKIARVRDGLAEVIAKAREQSPELPNRTGPPVQTSWSPDGKLLTE